MGQHFIFWIIFGFVIIVLPTLDLGLFHKKSHAVSAKEGISWTAVLDRFIPCIGHWLKERQYGIDTLNPDLMVRVKWMAEAKEIAMLDLTERPFYYDRIYYGNPYALRLSLSFSQAHAAKLSKSLSDYRRDANVLS